MKTSKIALTIFLNIFCVTILTAQINYEALNNRWELVTVERLGATMFGMGDEMNQLDIRDTTKIVFRDGERSDSILYKVVDQEIRLFDTHEKQLAEELIWKIEYLTKRELYLLFITRSDKKELMRLKYQALE